MFKRVDNNIDLAKNEDKTAKYWDEINDVFFPDFLAS